MDKVKSKIIKMPAKENGCLSEDDILHLFLGLLNLVKKSARLEALSEVKEKIQMFENENKRLTNLINNKNAEIIKLKAKLMPAE